MVGTLLPSTLDERLSALLPTLFALPASFSSELSDSQSSQSSDPSPPNPSHPLPASTAALLHDLTHLHHLTPLGLSLLPHLLAHLAPQLSKLHSTALSRHINYAASTHALELEESAQDLIAEIQQVGDEGVSELQRQAGYVLDEVREKGRDVGVEVAEGLEDGLWKAGERVFGDVVRRLENSVEKQVKWSGSCECRCSCPCAASGAARLRGRMGSGRTGKGGYCNLGDRWKIAAAASARFDIVYMAGMTLQKDVVL